MKTRWIRPVAQRVFNWGHGIDELSPAAIVDFGIDDFVCEASLKTAIKNGAMAEELDRALGHGAKIVKLVEKYAPKFNGVEFATSWDAMAGR